MGQRCDCGMATPSLTWCPVFLLEVGSINFLSLLLSISSKVPPYELWESLISQVSCAHWEFPQPPISWGCLFTSQGLTLLLRLWSAHKKGFIMTALQKIQQAAERVRCIYLHPTNGQKQLLLNLGRLKEFEEKGDHIGEPAVLINLDPRDISTLDHQTDSTHHLIWGTQHTYSRRILDLCSFRDDAPNRQDTGGPR